jgi:hypothetical protein
MRHHKKLLAKEDNDEKLQTATLTDIQGFPQHRKDVTIYEMVEEVKRDDAQFSRVS